MDVHTAFSVILPESFPAHVSSGDRNRKKERKKKLTEKELPWTGNKKIILKINSLWTELKYVKVLETKH